jgi:putative heme-binding domain-containing protein
MLDSRQAPEVQLAAVQALAGFPEPEVAAILISAWSALSPAVRGEVTESLLARQAWIGPFLDALVDQRIPVAHLDANHRSRLVKHRDPDIQKRAATLLAGDVLSPRNDIIADYRQALELAGDAARGQKVFEKTCITCHKAGGRGHEVGPDLATIQNRTPDELLTQILDPSRQVQPNYISYVIALDDGRVVSGLIAAESPTSITLKRAENVQETILRQNIEEINGTGKSLMPEGLEKNINRQDISDLIAYLLGLKK